MSARSGSAPGAWTGLTSMTLSTSSATTGSSQTSEAVSLKADQFSSSSYFSPLARRARAKAHPRRPPPLATTAVEPTNHRGRHDEHQLQAGRLVACRAFFVWAWGAPSGVVLPHMRNTFVVLRTHRLSAKGRGFRLVAARRLPPALFMHRRLSSALTAVLRARPVAGALSLPHLDARVGRVLLNSYLITFPSVSK
jgi:hypothetical protein